MTERSSSKIVKIYKILDSLFPPTYYRFLTVISSSSSFLFFELWDLVFKCVKRTVQGIPMCAYCPTHMPCFCCMLCGHLQCFGFLRLPPSQVLDQSYSSRFQPPLPRFQLFKLCTEERYLCPSNRTFTFGTTY